MFKTLSKWLHNDSGEAYVGEAVKIVIAVVLGAALLTGLILINNKTILPTVEAQIRRQLLFARLRVSDSDAYNELQTLAWADLYSNNDTTKFYAMMDLWVASGAVEEDGLSQEFEDGFTDAMVAKYGSREAYDALSNDEQLNFQRDFSVDYAAAHGVNMNETVWDQTVHATATDLYNSLSSISAAEYAEARERALTEEGFRFPETQPQSEAEMEAWLNSADGISYMEILLFE